MNHPPSSPSKPGLRIGNYLLGETLGVGSFGKVKVAEHEVTRHKVAVKILNRKKIKTLRMDEKIRREIQILKLFRHPHIIKLYEVIETPTDIFMVMEYVSGGELFDFIVQHGKVSESTARSFFQQVIAGVEYCHHHMVVHRDLKPENLLLDSQNNVKIADFGLSNMMKDGDFLKTSCGSPNYAAPEVISGQLYAGTEVDIWSCGVILFALLCARLPFDDEYIPNLFKKIREGIFTFPGNLSADCRSLISSMLVVDPLKRTTIAEIRQHPWFVVQLPSYLMSPPEKVTSRAIERVEEDILQELMLKFGVSRQVARQQLREDKTLHHSVEINESGDGDDAEDTGTMSPSNQFVVAYHLISDHKRVYHRRHSREIVQPRTSPRSPSKHAIEMSTSPPLSLRDEAQFDVGSTMIGTPITLDSFDRRDVSNVSTGFPRKMWSLGITTAHEPAQIMQQLTDVLRECGLEWKSTTPYQMRCRPVSHDENLKFAVQLYKLKDHTYLLDFKRIGGNLFPFFDRCSHILETLLETFGEEVTSHSPRDQPGVSNLTGRREPLRRSGLT